MSYDFTLYADTGAPDGARPEVYWRNHTSNTAAMWRHAGADLAEMSGKRAADVAPLLAGAVELMRADELTYRQWDAPNGWGDYASTLEFLTAIAEACALHPATIVHVSH